MIVATGEIVHLDQTTRMIGIEVIVDTLRVAIRTGMTIGPEVEHAVRRPGGRGKGIIDVETTVQGAEGMIVAIDIIEVNGSRRNMMTVYPHRETTIDPATIDHHHLQGTTTDLTILITNTKPNQISPDHQQWTWPLVPPPLALRLHLHLVHLRQVETRWTNNAPQG
jgi:hypothetical protein